VCKGQAHGVKANVLFLEKKPASETAWTKKLWIYDLRTNKHFTLKSSPLKRTDLDEFVDCYLADPRTETWSEESPSGLPAEKTAQTGLSACGHAQAERWRVYNYEELIARDKASLDIFWLRDESLEDSENLPEPDVLAQEMIEDLEAALEQIQEIAGDLNLVRE